MTGSWPWPDELDGVVAAPDSHRVLLENDEIRVLEVTIPPGRREPAHTHPWPSVMLIDAPARIRYYGEDGALQFESPPATSVAARESNRPRVEWLEPEGPHAVENIDAEPYHAIRIELLGARGRGA